MVEDVGFDGCGLCRSTFDLMQPVHASLEGCICTPPPTITTTITTTVTATATATATAAITTKGLSYGMCTTNRCTAITTHIQLLSYLL